MRKTVVTITGIRPDFIRMANIFRLLDINFRHILIHTGQHYDDLLSGSFFNDLQIRKPDYVLSTGKQTSNHFEQLAYLSVEIPKLFHNENITPDVVLFLGDSNSVGAAFPLKKAGYRIGHIEAGMRSTDKRMLEEINRTVCDHCSDVFFVYHDDYRAHLLRENIRKNIFVVGNTIVEPCLQFLDTSKLLETPKRNDVILLDIHRPENFNYPDRIRNIVQFANRCIERYGLPVQLLYFKRLKDSLVANDISLGQIQMIDLMPYNKYLETCYHCKFVISDSGTAGEELPLLNTPVVVPRDYSERPQSYASKCSVPLFFDSSVSPIGGCDGSEQSVFDFIENGAVHRNTLWLYPPDCATSNKPTSVRVIEGLREWLNVQQDSKQ